MMGDIFVLLGLALFIKFFFDSGKKLFRLNGGEAVTQKNLVWHGALGILFIVIGRLVVMM